MNETNRSLIVLFCGVVVMVIAVLIFLTWSANTDVIDALYDAVDYLNDHNDDAGRLIVTLAALILIAVAILARGVAIERTRTTEVVAGVFSGVSAIVGAIGGPPVGLLYRNDPPPMVRSTLGVIFAFGLVISIALRAAGGKITTTDLRITLWLLPAMFIGFAASNRFKNRIDGPRLRAWILAVSALAAVTLVVRTLTG